jgi:hypothetical protein
LLDKSLQVRIEQDISEALLGMGKDLGIVVYEELTVGIHQLNEFGGLRLFNSGLVVSNPVAQSVNHFDALVPICRGQVHQDLLELLHGDRIDRLGDQVTLLESIRIRGRVKALGAISSGHHGGSSSHWGP